ncbi:ProP effector [Achromobacter xylosoxidans C54]|nr:ProP effector [Achromobacter xylosoxidans C54]
MAATSDWKTSSPAASHTSARRVAADLRVNVTGVCIPMVPTSLRRPPDARNFNPTRHNCYAPRFQHLNSQHTMGLEQLAAIRELLLKQAPEEAASKKKPARPAANEAGSRKPSARPAGDAAAARKKPARAPAGERREAPAVDPVLIAISRLQRQFPKAFPKKPAPKVPLKLGVLEDLVQHAQTLQLSADEIKQAVKTWCDGRRYWDCMVESAARVDLNGEPNGAVTANEAQHAKRMASRRHAKAGGGRSGKGNAAKGKPAAEGAKPAQAEAAAPADAVVDTPVDTSVDTSVDTPAQAPSDTQSAD